MILKKSTILGKVKVLFYFLCLCINISYLSARTTISAAKTFEIRHRCQSDNTTHGFGQASDFGNNELYLIVKIFKEA